jgi:serine/threonine protein kinase
MPEPDPKIRCPHCRKEHPVTTERCGETGEEISAVFRMHGRTLNDKYEVVDVIGEGGMGIVYEGKQKALAKKIAVKFLYPTIKASDEVLARFQNEARVAASIAHKNIRDVIDMDTTPEGLPFIVMEYLEGRSLGEILERKEMLSPETAARITLQILSALNGVHSRGVVHRDLKPANIFICKQAGGEEIVKIVDFGISHLMRPPEGGPVMITQDNAIVGTPKYLSPEQAAGDKVDARTDLYAVGTILYEMVAGRHPFEETNYNKVIVAILTREPPPPRQFAPEIPEELEKLILKALEKEPYKRFSSAAEFAQAIRDTVACGDDGSILRIVRSAKPKTKDALEAASLPGQKPAMRWIVPIAISLPLILLLAGGSVMLFKYREIQKEISHALSAQKQKQKGAKPAGVQEKPRRHKVTLTGVPENASVYVDGVLCPENPVMLDAGKNGREFYIMAPGFVPWEKSVTIDGDITLAAEMIPAAESDASAEPGAKEGKDKRAPPEKKDGKLKKKTGTKDKGTTHEKMEGKPAGKTGKKKNKKIDTEYPEATE